LAENKAENGPCASANGHPHTDLAGILRHPQSSLDSPFLLANVRCDAKLKRGDGTWDSLKATWEGRSILDGYVIADEYRMTTPAGVLLVLGINLAR
jgi:hypothetical protein